VEYEIIVVQINTITILVNGTPYLVPKQDITTNQITITIKEREK